MCFGQKSVGGLYLSALPLQQTAELQANKPHYHHHHQRQIPLQRLSAVYITAQTCTYAESSALERLALKKEKEKKQNIWLFHCIFLKGQFTQMAILNYV